MNRENLAQIKTYALGIAALLYSDFSEVCSEDGSPHYKPQWEPSNDWYSAMTRELLRSAKPPKK
ncbi:MAG: hypothetical protein EBE86_014010 [Hormoscilla sp. GUM202]|nr:hypothetical protein [Hormoscilla sp. GUM202]